MPIASSARSCKRFALAYLFCAFLLLTGLEVSGKTVDQGRMVSGAGYTGVILTPEMMLASGTWKRLDPERKKLFEFWTPTNGQIARAEKALALRLDQDRTDSGPGGFRYQTYFSPKYYSRDHLKRAPEDVIYQDWLQILRASPVRQYIGVTEGGEKELLMVFLTNSPDAAFKSRWIESDLRFFYQPKWDQFIGADFFELDDD